MARGASLACLAAVACGAVACGASAADRPDLRRLSYADLQGWSRSDHVRGFAAFRASCRAIERGEAAVQGAVAVSDEFVSACLASAALFSPDPTNARHFFEAWFDPFEATVAGRAGFLTGYYEPELAGSLARTDAFPVPLRGPPADLVPAPAGELPAGWPEGATAARRTGAGFAALPDRAAIEAGALDAEAPPVVFLADPVDAFMVHVQGSARIRLADGRVLRVGFAGRNGHPYTSVGRELARDLGLPPSEMTADKMVAWLKAHPDRAGEMVARNRSYIFFRRQDEIRPDEGPVGAAGVPLLPGVSLAVDRTAWSYGTPVWLEGELPRPDGSSEPLARLVVAHDTGAAIVGPIRGDLFFGSGEEAGRAAGLARQAVRWVVFVPKMARSPFGTLP